MKTNTPPISVGAHCAKRMFMSGLFMGGLTGFDAERVLRRFYDGRINLRAYSRAISRQTAPLPQATFRAR